jgi:quercetin dioxygenase-like cupin family protein
VLEARWWALAGASSAWVDPGRRRWHASTDGVDVLPLRGDADVVSMLVRFAAGASVANHRHALDEDCLVLQGEMFLGDILLRAGDYQLAPAGGTHFGETSDVGVPFFFHGALDPVLRGTSATAR